MLTGHTLSASSGNKQGGTGTTQLNLLPREDYKNAEEQMMRPEVLKQLFLPLYETFYDAIHTSEEFELKYISFYIELHGNTDALVDEVARIIGFTHYGFWNWLYRRVES